MLATKETAIARAKICSGCDRLFKPTFSCKACGCFLKLKVRVASQSCPMGKWHPTDEVTEP